MLTVLTPTGARPEAFAACVEQMRAQVYPAPVRWVVVDDGPDPMPTPQIDGWDVRHIRPEPLWQPGQNTHARNLLAGLDHCTGRVVIIEDDDEVAPWWLAVCEEWLTTHELVGESHSLYRHRETGRVTEMRNNRHASLCSTAMRGMALSLFRRICAEHKDQLDTLLWQRFDGPKRLYRPEPRGVVGVKGWPGREGIGVGHKLR